MTIISQTKEDRGESSLRTVNTPTIGLLMLQIVTTKHREAVLTLSILIVLL